jgi:hypoxanthine phosphoribosyltransferase
MHPEQIELNGHRFRRFLTRQQIAAIVERLAQQLRADYAGITPVCLIVLKGAFVFAGRSAARGGYPLPCGDHPRPQLRHGDALQRTGGDPAAGAPAYWRRCVAHRGYRDSGLTLRELLGFLRRQQPASLRIVALLAKPSARELQPQPDYIGLEIPPLFVVGYGMDYAEHGRYLPDIYALEEPEQGNPARERTSFAVVDPSRTAE